MGGYHRPLWTLLMLLVVLLAEGCVATTVSKNDEAGAKDAAVRALIAIRDQDVSAVKCLLYSATGEYIHKERPSDVRVQLSTVGRTLQLSKLSDAAIGHAVTVVPNVARRLLESEITWNSGHEDLPHEELEPLKVVAVKYRVPARGGTDMLVVHGSRRR